MLAELSVPRYNQLAGLGVHLMTGQLLWLERDDCRNIRKVRLFFAGNRSCALLISLNLRSDVVGTTGIATEVRNYRPGSTGIRSPRI